MRAWFASITAVLAAVLAAYPLAAAPEGRQAWALAAGGLLCTGLALTVRRARGLAWVAVLLLAGHYAAALHAGTVEIDVYAPLVAIALFAFAECMDLFVALTDVAPIAPATLRRRVTASALLAAAGGSIALVAILSRSLLGGAFAGVVVGAACVLGLIALPLWLAPRPWDQTRARSSAASDAARIGGSP